MNLDCSAASRDEKIFREYALNSTSCSLVQHTDTQEIYSNMTKLVSVNEVHPLEFFSVLTQTFFPLIEKLVSPMPWCYIVLCIART